MEDEEKGDFKKVIDKIDININNFIFDFSFSPRPTFFTEIEPPGKYILPHRLQYLLFRKMLVADYENIELINSTKHFFINDKYTFEFFITILDDIIIYSRNEQKINNSFINNSNKINDYNYNYSYNNKNINNLKKINNTHNKSMSKDKKNHKTKNTIPINLKKNNINKN